MGEEGDSVEDGFGAARTRVEGGQVEPAGDTAGVGVDDDDGVALPDVGEDSVAQPPPAGIRIGACGTPAGDSLDFTAGARVIL